MKIKALVFGLVLGLTAKVAVGATNGLYFTRFEATEGFSVASPLIGQAGWTGQGTSGNGLTNNFVAGQGQQALIGRRAINPAEDVYAWYPLDFNPVTAGFPIVKFSTLMSIEDSTNGQYDNFRWSVYNIDGVRLFSLDFDNYDSTINYDLDDTNVLASTGWAFETGTDYEVTLSMNFASNRWSAILNGVTIVTNQPMTTKGSTLTLGDIDAVWLPYYPDAPGNNFMLFDDYRVTAETLPVPPARVNFLGRTAEGWGLVRVSGSEGSRWALEGTTNLVNWTALITNQISGGLADHIDTTAAGQRQRFYRARLVP